MTRVAILLAVLATLGAASVHADETWTLRGTAEFDQRATIEGESRWLYNEMTFGMTVQGMPSPKVRLLGSFQIDAIGFDERLEDSRTFYIGDQQDRVVTDPVRLELDEAYLMVTGFGLRNLDIKLGKQRIAWGTGDQFNPTDNLNPDDFHDPLQFGKKTPTPSVLAQYYAGPVTISAVFLPLFYPALLPQTDIRPIFEKQFDTMASEFEIDTGDARLDAVFDELMLSAIQDASLGDITVSSKIPSRTTAHSSAAAKISGTAGFVDMSASYAYVYDDFGVPRYITMEVSPLTTGLKLIDEVDLHVEQEFPREHVVGADFAMSVPGIDIGWWGEAAYFVPVDRFDTEYFLDAHADINAVLSSIAGEDFRDGLVIARDEPLAENFVKAVSGVDYTFPGAWYVNAQYIRGLPTDNTADLVSDYAFAGVDKPLFNDTVKPRVFGGVCFEDKSWVLYPQVFFYPADSVEFQLGTFFVFGDVDTKFGAFGDHIAFLRAKAYF